jgi:hypothetical protein
MPKVELSFNIRARVTQRVDVPQAVIDQYQHATESDDFDGRVLDRLLEPYVKYENITDELDDPEDIELELVQGG